MGHVDDAHYAEDYRKANTDHRIKRSRKNAAHNTLNKGVHRTSQFSVRALGSRARTGYIYKYEVIAKVRNLPFDKLRVNGFRLKSLTFSVRGELVEPQKNTFAIGSYY